MEWEEIRAAVATPTWRFNDHGSTRPGANLSTANGVSALPRFLGTPQKYTRITTEMDINP